MGLFNSARSVDTTSARYLAQQIKSIETNHRNFLPSELLSGQPGTKAGILFRKAADGSASMTVVYSPSRMNQATTAEKIELAANGEITKVSSYFFAGVELPTRADMFEPKFSDYVRAQGASSEAFMTEKPVTQNTKERVALLLGGIIAESGFQMASLPERRSRRVHFIYDGN